MSCMRCVAVVIALYLPLAACGIEAPTEDSIDEPELAADALALDDDAEADEFAVDDSTLEDMPDVALVGAQIAQALPDRPAFKMPFLCGQKWRGNNYFGHHPAHAIDWNHYDANGNPDDPGRRVVASASGRVVASYRPRTNNYGRVIVIKHGSQWFTLYAHLRRRLVDKGDTVTIGEVIGRVGKSGTSDPHLHYEQRFGSTFNNSSVVVSVVQGLEYSDYTDTFQISSNGCDVCQPPSRCK